MPRIGSMFMVGALLMLTISSLWLLAPVRGAERPGGAGVPVTHLIGNLESSVAIGVGSACSAWRWPRQQGLLPRQVVPEHAQKLHGTL